MSFLGSQLDEYVGSAIDPTADDDGGNDADAEEKQSWQLNPLHAAKKVISGSRAQSVDLDRNGDDVTGRVIPLSLDYLIEAPNVKEWLAITTWVSIWAGIAYSILLVRGTLLLVDMTCRSTNYNRKSLRKFNKSRTRIIPRLMHWYRSWFGPTGPYFQWKEFAKDVQETILQGIAMYDITASGVQATWLAIYTSVIFINSTFEPFFLHVKVRSEKTISEASNLKWFNSSFAMDRRHPGTG
eukprot:g2668.t1